MSPRISDSYCKARCHKYAGSAVAKLGFLSLCTKMMAGKGPPCPEKQLPIHVSGTGLFVLAWIPSARPFVRVSDLARLVDAGRIRTTLTETLSPINAETLKKAHALIETNTARGKIVLEGF